MNLFYLAWRNILANPLGSALSIVLIAMGTGLISLLLQVNRNLDQQINRNLGEIDMVVGAKGAPLQLILSAVLQIDDPTGNILLDEVAPIMRNPMVKTAIPLAYGDNYRGYRIVGTSAAYPVIYGGTPAVGRIWDAPFEVCLGSGVAKATGLQPGDSFEGSHGLAASTEHHEQPFSVVGVFRPTGTVLDQLILTNLESIWAVHEENDSPAIPAADSIHQEPTAPREITALLLQFRSPLGTLTLGRTINENTRLQAAVPAFEISKLNQSLGLGTETLRALGISLILLAGASVFAALYQALEDRRYELAVLRAMGASPKRLAGLLCAEGLLLAITGFNFGLLISRLGLLMINGQLRAAFHQDLGGTSILPGELLLLPAVLAVGLCAALLPAWRAMRMNVSSVLGGGK